MVIGHEQVREALEQDLPPVTLLIGPRSIGKATLAFHVARYHNLGDYHTYYEKVNAATAREIVERAPVRRRSPDIRVIELDESTEAVQNILLKVLEEPPAHCRFILLASSVPLCTIVSRARVYRMGLLADWQVAEVLRNLDVPVGSEKQAAARGRGQVRPALEAIADRDATRVASVVAAAVRAASEGSHQAVDLAMRNWTPEHTRVLERWAMERSSGRWVHFSPEFAPAVTREAAMRLLYVLGTYDARTEAAVALEALKEKR